MLCKNRRNNDQYNALDHPGSPWINYVVICPFCVTQISEVVMVRKTEIEDREEEVVAIRLGKFEKICTQRGIRHIPEKVVRDSIEIFDLG